MANDFFKNTVSSKGQLEENEFVSFHWAENEKLRVLFVGNSITRHGIKKDIGWYRDCGMAASSIEKDYVHVTVAQLEKQYGPVSFCIAQVAQWERAFYETNLEAYRPARDFGADIVIVRVGENTQHSDEVLQEKNYCAHFGKMCEYFCEGARKTVVTGLFFRRDTIEASIEQVAGEKGYAFVKIDHLGDRDDCKALTEYAHEGVARHPNDHGMGEISKAILSGLNR